MGVLLLHSLPSSHFHGKSRKVILQITLQMLYLANADVVEKLRWPDKIFSSNDVQLWASIHSPMLSLVGYFKMYKEKRSFTQTRSLAVTVQATRPCQRKLTSEPFPWRHRWQPWEQAAPPGLAAGPVTLIQLSWACMVVSNCQWMSSPAHVRMAPLTHT